MSAFETAMTDLDECFRLVGNWQAEVRRLEELNAAANRIIAEQAEVIAEMHGALKDALFAMDGIIDGDFESHGSAVKGAVRSAAAALALVEQHK